MVPVAMSSTAALATEHDSTLVTATARRGLRSIGNPLEFVGIPMIRMDYDGEVAGGARDLMQLLNPAGWQASLTGESGAIVRSARRFPDETPRLQMPGDDHFSAPGSL